MSIEDHPAFRPMLSGDAQIWVALTGWTPAQLQAFMDTGYSSDGDGLGSAFSRAIHEYWLDDDELEADMRAPSQSMEQLLEDFSSADTLIEYLKNTGQLALAKPADTVIIHYGDGSKSYDSFVHDGIAFHKLAGPCPHTLNSPKVDSVTLKTLTNGKPLDITLHYSRHPFIMTTCIDGQRHGVEGDDVFNCFSKLRQLTPGVRWLCKGAKRNVLPSNMSRQMSGGLIAYESTLGHPALTKDQVSIFDFDDSNIVDSIEEQWAFRKAWIQSLRSND